MHELLVFQENITVIVGISAKNIDRDKWKGEFMKLSIIVPVYNLENYIATTLESLLSIHFSSDYEIVVINDGSRDGSESVIRDYQQKYSQIVLYSIKNQGVSNARNVGISKATGEYITFVDGDDTVEPDFFEKAVQELDNGGYDFVQGNYQIIEPNNVYFKQRVEIDEVIADRAVMLNRFLGMPKQIHNNCWGKVFRTELAKNVQFDRSLKVSEDQKYICDVIIKADKIKLMSDLCYHYYQRNSSAMHSMSTEKCRNRLEVLEYCQTFVSDDAVVANINKNKCKALLSMYITALRNQEDTSMIYSKISELDFSEFSSLLDWRTKFHILLLCRARNLYDMIQLWSEKND